MKKSILLFLTIVSISLFTNCEKESNQEDGLLIVNSIINKVNDSNIIEISLVSGEYEYLEKDGFEAAFTERTTPGDIVCEGTGYSFARCVKKAVDRGLTLKVYKKDGVYYAEEMEK